MSGSDQLFSYSSEEDDGYGDGSSGLYNVKVTVQSQTQHSDSEPVIADVEVEGWRLRIHVDTGSPVACISDVMYKELYGGHQLVPNWNMSFNTYDGKSMFVSVKKRKTLSYLLCIEVACH
ncbi:hypothetical protein O0L34_g19197 [Tuta absoluta]|nr:hypothetical protein O0L34_g19197 [Tuta absoluta]